MNQDQVIEPNKKGFKSIQKSFLGSAAAQSVCINGCAVGIFSLNHEYPSAVKWGSIACMGVRFYLITNNPWAL